MLTTSIQNVCNFDLALYCVRMVSTSGASESSHLEVAGLFSVGLQGPVVAMGVPMQDVHRTNPSGISQLLQVCHVSWLELALSTFYGQLLGWHVKFRLQASDCT